MIRTQPVYPLPALAMAMLVLFSCNHKRQGSETLGSEDMNRQVNSLLNKGTTPEQLLTGKYTGSLALSQPGFTRTYYRNNGGKATWSSGSHWLPAGDSMLRFIRESKYYGLFPEDYHDAVLDSLDHWFREDSLQQKERNNPALWAAADQLLTDAFFQAVRDIHLGRLPNDSITLRKDSTLDYSFCQGLLQSLDSTHTLSAVLHSLEPDHPGYRQLKMGIASFLRHADYREYTHVPDRKSAGDFQQKLQQRLYEGKYISFDSMRADSATLAGAIKRFQKEQGLTADGVAGEATIRMLNTSDREKFIRIAISLDKFKQLPERMPEKYIWVNVPAYYLDVVEDDTVRFSSRIICGKPKTRTPLLNSAVSTLITYPQWVPPPSIIQKEILPGVKKNPGYLAKKGFTLFDSKGEEVDPHSVDWSRYSKAIPYRVVQGSGDANALGIMKFYFDNKYSVYLHDTNQRYLFGLTSRSLSHGCVRVQDWEKLAFYILENGGTEDQNSRLVDSVKTWLARKQKKSIPVRRKMPVYIRYVTCEGKNGKIVFYDDPYEEDLLIRQKYFASK